MLSLKKSRSRRCWTCPLSPRRGRWEKDDGEHKEFCEKSRERLCELKRKTLQWKKLKQNDKKLGGIQFFEAIICRLNCELGTKKQRISELKEQLQKRVKDSGHCEFEDSLTDSCDSKTNFKETEEGLRAEFKREQGDLESALQSKRVTLEKLQLRLGNAKGELDSALSLVTASESRAVVEDIIVNAGHLTDDQKAEIVSHLGLNYDKLCHQVAMSVRHCVDLSQLKLNEAERLDAGAAEKEEILRDRIRAENELSFKLKLDLGVLKENVSKMNRAHEQLMELNERRLASVEDMLDRLAIDSVTDDQVKQCVDKLRSEQTKLLLQEEEINEERPSLLANKIKIKRKILNILESEFQTDTK